MQLHFKKNKKKNKLMHCCRQSTTVSRFLTTEDRRSEMCAFVSRHDPKYIWCIRCKWIKVCQQSAGIRPCCKEIVLFFPRSEVRTVCTASCQRSESKDARSCPGAQSNKDKSSSESSDKSAGLSRRKGRLFLSQSYASPSSIPQIVSNSGQLSTIHWTSATPMPW